MTLLNIPDDFLTFEDDHKIMYDFGLTIFKKDDNVKFCVCESSTSWMGLEDNFINRIQFDRLNPCFLEKHLLKEIEIRNALDDGADFINDGKYSKAIEMLDEVLYYDNEYGEALLLKSKALFGQGHFVKSLRHYKRAVKADDRLRDVEYHKLLLAKFSEERDNFPKIKRNIYAGDEYFAKGEFGRALESYDKALANPTDFKNRILSKLLNKKGTALVKLDRIDEAVSVFRQSAGVKPNDYAYFYLGIYDYGLSSSTFKKHLRITKGQLLLKAKKLYECGEAGLALGCLDEFFDNHYRVDGDYKLALELKLDVLNRMGKDTGSAESLCGKLFG